MNPPQHKGARYNNHHNKNKIYPGVRGVPEVFFVFFLGLSTSKGLKNKVGIWKGSRDSSSTTRPVDDFLEIS